MSKRGKKHRRSLPILMVILLSALLGACGVEDPSGKTVQTMAGVVTSGTPTIGTRLCMQCHPSVAADWEVSRHGNSNASPSGSGPCALCHNENGDKADFGRSMVGCESCHGPGSLHYDGGGAGPIGTSRLTSTVLGTVPVSAQFSTCTYCHELLDSTGTFTYTNSPGFHTTNDEFNVQDSHAAQFGVWAFTNGSSDPTGTILGYAMDFNSETVCVDCHDPHGTADINREWVYSAHADTAYNGAWTRYNWSCDGTSQDGCGKSGPNINNRKACQRCHTTSGFAAYSDALRSANATLAEQIVAGTASPAPVPYTQGTLSTGSWKAEMLQCRGCHADTKRALRNPGQYTAPYSISYNPGGDRAVYTAQYDDVGGSNICIACHSGRVSGVAIKALNTTTTATVDFSNLNANTFAGNFLPHDKVGAGVMFKKIGYEYTGRNYTNPNSYRHDEIGTAYVPNTGANGPCVGCHMFRADQVGNHLFMPVSRTGSVITNVTSEVCYNCHAGSSTQLADVLQEDAVAFEEAISVFEMVLTAASFTPQPGFPPFTNTSWLSVGDTDTTGNKTGKNNMGAAFNFEVMAGDAAAYVHNRTYAKRLMYDSIDWLDDNSLNFTTGETIEALCPLCLEAKTYLLPFGILPGSPAERP